MLDRAWQRLSLSKFTPNITSLACSNSIDQDYRFEDLVVGGDDEGRREEEKKEVDQKSKAASQAPVKGEEAAPEDSPEEDEGEDGDEEEYNLYYERDEIESIQYIQQVDGFEDVKETREDCLLSAAGSKALNKICIEDYMPKPDADQNIANQKSRKSNKTKSMKSSHTGDFIDDRNQNDMDADEALEIQKKKDSKID